MPRPPHGTVRGSESPNRFPSFEGLFGRMFRTLPPAKYSSRGKTQDQLLAELAASMYGAEPASPGTMPAGYTYLGQFIDHDITFDPATSLQRVNDVDALVDFRTPRFDLDSVYGRGPDDQPYLYTHQVKPGLKMALGRPMTSSPPFGGFDLPRFNGRALTGEPRNDGHVIISQLHGIFLCFHNRMVDELTSNGVDPAIEDVQREVRWHYQWVILKDFLPRIVNSRTYSEVMSGGAGPSLRFYIPRRNGAYMPVEFSAAAYRFGHSMVAPSYRLNRGGPGVGGPFDIMGPVKGRGVDNLVGFGPFATNWGIDWSFFFEGFDLPPAIGMSASPAVQYAHKIGTTLAGPLANLPFRPPPTSLAERNLQRGVSLGLPSGQSVARAMGLAPMSDKAGIDPAFAGNAPLWYYVLAEAEASGDGRLGPVGGRIVMETIVGLLLADSHSYLSQQPLWRPLEKLCTAGGDFTMTEFVKAALKL